MITRSHLSQCISDCHHLAGELRWLANQVGDRVIRELMILGAHRMDMCTREAQFALDRLHDADADLAADPIGIRGPAEHRLDQRVDQRLADDAGGMRCLCHTAMW